MCSHLYRKRQTRKDRKTNISNWMERLFIFCALWFWHSIDILSHPNIFLSLTLWNEVKRVVPIFVAKQIQIEMFDLKSFIPPAVFDPINLDPNSLSKSSCKSAEFNLNLFFLTQSKLNPKCSLFSSKGSWTRAPIKQMRFQSSCRCWNCCVFYVLLAPEDTLLLLTKEYDLNQVQRLMMIVVGVLSSP